MVFIPTQSPGRHCIEYELMAGLIVAVIVVAVDARSFILVGVFFA